MSGGTAKLADVWAMLDDCAPGWTKETRKRHHCVRYNDREYPGLPLGAPGAKRPEVPLPHIKHLAEHLLLDPACVNRHFSQIRLKPRPAAPAPPPAPQAKR